ncbi:hypothetical protein ZWY2020_023122 [Hordeum vulgare]|nr:hypothetical protein ZWY2020_023122 [Hordeum vulgare]
MIHSSQPETDVYTVHTHGVQPYTTMLAASKRILHTCETVLTGFAVRLTTDEATHMSKLADIRAVYRSRISHTQTTRSPGFLGFQEGADAWPESEFGNGVIIGLINTGIYPDHPVGNGLAPEARGTWRPRLPAGARPAPRRDPLHLSSFVYSRSYPL